MIIKIEVTVADEEACKMEHALSSATLDHLADFLAFVQTCPAFGESWCNYLIDCCNPAAHPPFKQHPMG